MKTIQTIFNWLIFGTILITPVIIIYKLDKIEAKVTRPVVYQVDNSGGVMVGRITDKEIVDGRYYVVAGAYGKFLVTKEQYEAIKVGDEIPGYLKGRGS